VAVDVHELRCAGCGYLIQLQGNTWVHCAGLVRPCPDVDGIDQHARPEPLDVAWHRFGNGSESHHLVHEGVTYVLWRHTSDAMPSGGTSPRWSAWRTEVLRPAETFGAPIPHLTMFTLDHPYRSHVLDPRQLLAAMPPLVAYWITESVFAF